MREEAKGYKVYFHLFSSFANLKKLYSHAHNIRILYGGSVKESNIREILSVRNVDGALVGGASLQSASFNKILEYSGVC